MVPLGSPSARLAWQPLTTVCLVFEPNDLARIPGKRILIRPLDSEEHHDNPLMPPTGHHVTGQSMPSSLQRKLSCSPTLPHPLRLSCVGVGPRPLGMVVLVPGADSDKRPDTPLCCSPRHLFVFQRKPSPRCSACARTLTLTNNHLSTGEFCICRTWSRLAQGHGAMAPGHGHN